MVIGEELLGNIKDPKKKSLAFIELSDEIFKNTEVIINNDLGTVISLDVLKKQLRKIGFSTKIKF